MSIYASEGPKYGGILSRLRVPVTAAMLIGAAASGGCSSLSGVFKGGEHDKTTPRAPIVTVASEQLPPPNPIRYASLESAVGQYAQVPATNPKELDFWNGWSIDEALFVRGNPAEALVLWAPDFARDMVLLPKTYLWDTSKRAGNALNRRIEESEYSDFIKVTYPLQFLVHYVGEVLKGLFEQVTERPLETITQGVAGKWISDKVHSDDKPAPQQTGAGVIQGGD